MKTRAEALEEGYTIDDSSAGRPWAYKGPRFAATSAFPIHTDLEVELMDRLKTMVDCFDLSDSYDHVDYDLWNEMWDFVEKLRGSPR